MRPLNIICSGFEEKLQLWLIDGAEIVFEGYLADFV